MTLTDLRRKIEAREASIGVIGLGYVGLTVACALADVGFRVVGVEIKPDRVQQINAGRSPIEGHEPGLAELIARITASGWLRATTAYDDLRSCEVVFINVETPVDDDHVPHFEALKAACRSLGPALKDGALVIVESTITPGTMDRLVQPLLIEATGRWLSEGFYLGHCPERVMPGKLLANLRGLSRVCGGSTPETAETMMALYRTIVHAELDASDCVTAELVKTAENAYRDVNIAFANELALVCEATGGDFLRVRELVNKSPGRNVLLAGAGVGGHCIPKDPWLLVYSAGDEVPLQLVPSARAVNDAMPGHVAKLIEQGLARHGHTMAGARVVVMGYAYLENSDDTRNSPSAVLIGTLKNRGAEVVVHDPYVPAYAASVEQLVQGADAVAFVVAHEAYRRLALSDLQARMRTPVLVDGRRIFDPRAARAAGFTYLAIGLGLDLGHLTLA